MNKPSLKELVRDFSNRVIETDEQLLELALKTSSCRIQTINLHHLALCKKDPAFEKSVRTADLITADGWPVVWMLRVLEIRVTRVTGATFIENLTSNPAGAGHSIGLLGATEQVGDKWSAMLSKHERQLIFREHGDAADWDPVEIAGALAEQGVGLLTVAVTPPLGDNLARAIHDAGFRGAIVPVGGAVDMVTGLRPRAPQWSQTLGLEWLHRLLSEPRRLWRRYFLECTPVLLEFLPTAAIYYWNRLTQTKAGDSQHAGSESNR